MYALWQEQLSVNKWSRSVQSTDKNTVWRKCQRYM